MRISERSVRTFSLKSNRSEQHTLAQPLLQKQFPSKCIISQLTTEPSRCLATGSNFSSTKRGTRDLNKETPLFHQGCLTFNQEKLYFKPLKSSKQISPAPPELESSSSPRAAIVNTYQLVAKESWKQPTRDLQMLQLPQLVSESQRQATVQVIDELLNRDESDYLKPIHASGESPSPPTSHFQDHQIIQCLTSLHKTQINPTPYTECSQLDQSNASQSDTKSLPKQIKTISTPSMQLRFTKGSNAGSSTHNNHANSSNSKNNQASRQRILTFFSSEQQQQQQSSTLASATANAVVAISNIKSSGGFQLLQPELKQSIENDYDVLSRKGSPPKSRPKSYSIAKRQLLSSSWQENPLRMQQLNNSIRNLTQIQQTYNNQSYHNQSCENIIFDNNQEIPLSVVRNDSNLFTQQESLLRQQNSSAPSPYLVKEKQEAATTVLASTFFNLHFQPQQKNAFEIQQSANKDVSIASTRGTNSIQDKKYSNILRNNLDSSDKIDFDYSISNRNLLNHILFSQEGRVRKRTRDNKLRKSEKQSQQQYSMMMMSPLIDYQSQARHTSEQKHQLNLSDLNKEKTRRDLVEVYSDQVIQPIFLSSQENGRDDAFNGSFQELPNNTLNIEETHLRKQKNIDFKISVIRKEIKVSK